jgi:hypothetical protein
MVGARGFEPPTPWSRTKCATRLRYAPTRLIYYTNFGSLSTLFLLSRNKIVERFLKIIF